MNGFAPNPALGGNSGCFLPEGLYFRTILRTTREAVMADAPHDPRAGQEFRCVYERIESDDDICEATEIGMLADLSGAEAEEMARVIKVLGAGSSAEVVNELRISYAACVRELHAKRRLAASEDLLGDLALQLVDPIRSLPTPSAAFATVKTLVELLSHVGIELDAWSAALWIRVVHPNSRVGASKALMSLAADYRKPRNSAQRGSIALEPQSELSKRHKAPRKKSNDPKPAIGGENGA